VYLDGLYYDRDWTPLDQERFAALQRGLVTASRCVIDGNYASTLPIRLQAADTVVFLDLPAWACRPRLECDPGDRPLRLPAPRRAGQAPLEDLPDPRTSSSPAARAGPGHDRYDHAAPLYGLALAPRGVRTPRTVSPRRRSLVRAVRAAGPGNV
jgi:hypothetical protein